MTARRETQSCARSTSARSTSLSYDDSQSNGLCRGSSIGLKASPPAVHGLIACVMTFAARIEIRGRFAGSSVRCERFCHSLFCGRPLGLNATFSIEGLQMIEPAVQAPNCLTRASRIRRASSTITSRLM